jgi:hypothetical protein
MLNQTILLYSGYTGGLLVDYRHRNIKPKRGLPMQALEIWAECSQSDQNRAHMPGVGGSAAGYGG